MAQPERLQAEIQYFESKCDEWAKQHNREYAVVHSGTTLLGFYRDFGDAMADAYNHDLDEGAFLVQQVLPSTSQRWVSHIAD